MRATIIMLLCLAATLGACATNENTAGAAPEKREVVTGSNIARRDRADSNVTVMSREDLERARTSAGGSAGSAIK